MRARSQIAIEGVDGEQVIASSLGDDSAQQGSTAIAFFDQSQFSTSQSNCSSEVLIRDVVMPQRIGTGMAMAVDRTTLTAK